MGNGVELVDGAVGLVAVQEVNIAEPKEAIAKMNVFIFLAL
jgi:hypothetical protein